MWRTTPVTFSGLRQHLVAGFAVQGEPCNDHYRDRLIPLGHSIYEGDEARFHVGTRLGLVVHLVAQAVV